MSFTAWANNLALSLGLEAKKIKGGVIWTWTVLEVIVARLDVIVEPEWVVTSFKTERDVIVLGSGKTLEMSNVLFLESKEDIEERGGALFFLLCFLLVTRVKVTFSVTGTSTAIYTLEEGTGTELGL